MALVAAVVSKCVVRALGNHGSSTSTPTTSVKGTSTKSEGKMYDEHEVAMLKGFCHVGSVGELPPIWSLFQTSKNVDTHRANIKASMEEWAKKNGVPIER